MHVAHGQTSYLVFFLPRLRDLCSGGSDGLSISPHGVGPCPQGPIEEIVVEAPWHPPR